MLFQIACGHVLRWPCPSKWPEYASYWCDECQGWKRLIAVEGREWKIKCEECRFGRWTGASKHIAVEKANNHSRGGHKRINVDFLVHPSNSERARNLYAGHRVALWINSSAPRTRDYHDPDQAADIPPF